MQETIPNHSNQRKRSYLGRHFRGDLSLGIAFWVNYAGGLAILLLLGHFLANTETQLSLVYESYLYLLFCLAGLLGIPWMMIGTWRSASKQYSRGGRKFWPILVKAVILFGAYFNTKTVLLGARMTVELVSIIAGDKGYLPYTIEISNGGIGIQFRGGLRAGAEQEFRKVLNSAPGAKLLYIESDGGRATEGMRIGRIVRDAKLMTYVATHCESAATYIFISGRERLISPGAKLGFHRPSSTVGVTTDNDAVRQFMLQAGISEDFVKHVMAVSATNTWYPSYQEMLDVGVVTGITVDGKLYRRIDDMIEPDAPAKATNAPKE